MLSEGFYNPPVLDNPLISQFSGSNGKKATKRCKCGWLGDPSGRSRCTSDQVMRYRSRISGTLMDRIDLHVEVPRISFEDMQGPKGKCSAAVRERETNT